jgi:hypothetical protein
MPDHTIQFTPERRDALRQLLAAPKFQADPGTFYAGASSERVRVACQAHVDNLLKRLLQIPGESVPADAMFKELRRALGALDRYDSEERDRICHYVEQIMDFLGIEDSGSLLGKWRYGLDLS